ncbi:PAS domain S-box protein [Halostella sp. JP-L12]|uniref:hybrid sensor histidine kinase/response regulator n=1 Tax=Halostella TaxID=1843185 RepID=UPI000EF76E63|nr:MULTISPECIES: PAS domain-containing sensor histidine kinase [Halostella]NHN49616.1 PAS domain S-box protein [Halostella sp. JP-L12]
MTESKRVLCVCDDAERREQLAAPLRWSAPAVSVDTAPGFDAAIDYVEDGNVDCVVSDYATVSAAPAILQAIRERHPDLPLLIVTEYDTPDGSGTAVAEVVDFVDELGQPGSDEAFAGWVANSMARNPADAAPPGGTRPEDVVRDVKRGLVDATSPMDVERAVCDQLTLGGRYSFAWIGEYDTGERQVVPWVTGAAVDDWSIAETFAVDPSTPETLIERVLRTRETTVVQDVGDHPLSVPWEETALDNDCTATVLAPLAADDELYGVLGVYTDDPEGVSEMERSAIEEIADTVSNVLHSMALRGRIEQQERVLRRYERLVETVGDGMYALDADGHFMTVNNGLVAMTGYTREGLLGEHVSIVMDEADVAEGREKIRGLLDGDAETAAMEMGVHTKDGRVVPCENQIALLTDDDGDLQGTVGVVRDITERKKRERELQRQNERLEAFAEIVSHDLRNPLSVAQGYLDLAMEQDSTSQLDNVDDALDRMEDIIGDVLALARHGQTVTETDPTDLTATVEEAWSNVSTEAATLSVDDLGSVAADRSRLLRLLENLFRNAIEHGGDDVAVRAGPLDVGDPAAAEALDPPVADAAENRRTAGFFVADDGRGMPEHVREHAFESDFTTSENGLGLGLWVVREVASAHGWTVTATESESGGARFEFADVKRPAE